MNCGLMSNFFLSELRMSMGFFIDSISLQIQGKHTHQAKLFISGTPDKFYHQLNTTLELLFLYQGPSLLRPDAPQAHRQSGQSQTDKYHLKQLVGSITL